MKNIVALLLSFSVTLMAWDGYDAMNSSYITLQSTYSKNDQPYIHIYDHLDYKEKDLLVLNVRRTNSFYIINAYDSSSNEKRMFEMQVSDGDDSGLTTISKGNRDRKMTFGEFFDKINIFKYLKMSE